MKRGGGNAKGSAFERWTCEKLSRLVDPEGKETHFWRTSMSGGRSTLQRRKGVKNEAQLGDIACITKHKQAQHLTKLFLIECKHLKRLDLEGSLLKGRGRLHRFWAKLAEEAEATDRHPLLIAKQNNFGTLLLSSHMGFTMLRRLYPVTYFLTTLALADEQTIRVSWFHDLCKTEDDDP
jgi:hypothetical protein